MRRITALAHRRVEARVTSAPPWCHSQGVDGRKRRGTPPRRAGPRYRGGHRPTTRPTFSPCLLSAPPTSAAVVGVVDTTAEVARSPRALTTDLL